jgi:hypothetical protein
MKQKRLYKRNPNCITQRALKLGIRRETLTFRENEVDS